MGPGLYGDHHNPNDDGPRPRLAGFVWRDRPDPLLSALLITHDATNGTPRQSVGVVVGVPPPAIGMAVAPANWV